MSIRMYFDPEQLIASGQLQQGYGSKELPADLPWVDCGSINLRGCTVRWDGSHGLPYVEIGDLTCSMNNQLPLSEWDNKETMDNCGYRYSTLRVSFEANNVGNLENESIEWTLAEDSDPLFHLQVEKRVNGSVTINGSSTCLPNVLWVAYSAYRMGILEKQFPAVRRIPLL